MCCQYPSERNHQQASLGGKYSTAIFCGLVGERCEKTEAQEPAEAVHAANHGVQRRQDEPGERRRRKTSEGEERSGKTIGQKRRW